MSLPNDYIARAKTFPTGKGIDTSAILKRIANLAPPQQDAEIKRIIAEGGPASDLMVHVMGKDVPAPRSAPQNKKINPPGTK